MGVGRSRRVRHRAQEPVAGEDFSPNEINLYKSGNHHGNFIDCVISRRLTITPAEVAHRSASLGHVGMVAMMVGRKIKWDPDKEQVIGDEVANRLIGRAQREPWQLRECHWQLATGNNWQLERQ